MNDPILDSANDAVYTLRTTAPGPAGRLPVTAEQLRGMASGDLFGLTQNAGMGWDPARLLGKQFLILSTQGGVRVAVTGARPSVFRWTQAEAALAAEFDAEALDAVAL